MATVTSNDSTWGPPSSSTFSRDRGAGRGRGRGGRGRGRGAFRGRGGARGGAPDLNDGAASSDIDPTPANRSENVPTPPSNAQTTSSKVDTPAPVPNPVNANQEPRPRPPKRLPSISIAPTPSVADSASPTTKNPKKKGQTRKASVTSSSAKSTPRLAPNETLQPAKDAPPHLSPIAVDVTNLVDKVRALAIARSPSADARDPSRPYTPNTGIDWADDDEEELPDLDDWVSPKKSGIPSSSVEAAEDRVSSEPPTSEREPGDAHPPDKPSPTARAPLDPNDPKALALERKKAKLKAKKQEKKAAAAAAKSAAAQAGALPSTPPPNARPLPSGDPRPEEPNRPVVVRGGRPPKSPEKLMREVQAQNSPSRPSLPTPSTPEPAPTPSKGLRASMHAPSPVPSPPATPAQPTNPTAQTRPPHFPSPSTRGRHSPFRPHFHPRTPEPHTHTRAHSAAQQTLQPPQYHSMPGSPSAAARHLRTQSSPQTGQAHARAHSRPVISMDALARINKSLGGAVTSEGTSRTVIGAE